MRTVLVMLAFSLAVLCSRAQTLLPGIGISPQPGFFSRYHTAGDSTQLHKNWSVSGYLGMGMAFYNGYGSTYFGPQVGIDLNRRLNNNWYAFTGVSAAPAYFNFNRPLTAADVHNNMFTPKYSASGLAVYSGIHAGLMYVNDAKTFSISGSIGVTNGGYPYYPRPVKTKQ